MKGYKIAPPKRRRSDKIDLQLRVFDMATEGKTFKEIARHLKKRGSTVKSAYLVAHSIIFGKPEKKIDSVFIKFPILISNQVGSWIFSDANDVANSAEIVRQSRA